MNADSPIGVIFDMDGVLVDSAAPHFRSWQLLAEEHGRTVTEAQFAETFGRQNRDIIPIFFGQVAEAEIRTLADRKEELYRSLIRQDPPIVKGAIRIVRSLHRAAVRLAVGSSGPRANIDLVLSAMGVMEHISAVVSGDDITRGKPDPQVFSVAADRLGLDPRRCVVIEDAPVGVCAARAAGARVIAVLLYHPADAFLEADLTVEHLADLELEQVSSLVSC